MYQVSRTTSMERPICSVPIWILFILTEKRKKNMVRLLFWIGICFSCVCWSRVSGVPVKKNITSVCNKEDLYAVCNLVANPNRPSKLNGTMLFMQPVTGDCEYDFLSVQVEIENVPTKLGSKMAQKHGFHIHTFGDMCDGCESMGGHYNPHGTTHGSPWHPMNSRHVGDLGNVLRRGNGKIKTRMVDYLALLHGPTSIIGRGIVLHAKEDDLGLNTKDPESLRTGNAGARIGCCVIGRSNFIDRSKFSLYRR